MEKKNYPYIYFIDNTGITLSEKISLSLNVSNSISILEKIKAGVIIQAKTNEKLLYNLYRFKLNTPEINLNKKNKHGLNLEFEYENKKLYSMIKMPYLSMDNYLYDFELKEKEMEDKSIFNKKQKLNVKEQFEVYKNFLEKDLKIKQKDNKEWKNLLFSTFILFKDDFAFNFYIIIFNECISSPICRCKIISYFEPKKIIEIGEIDERNKKMATNYINMFKKNPKNFMTYCKDEIETHRIGIKLFAFILFYYYKYIRKEFPKLLENKDEKSIIYINNVLMSYRYLFMDIKLTKERVLELINISTSFIDLTNSVEYLDTLQDLLDVILFNFEKFKILYIKEIEKDLIPKKIDIESIITPKKEDDMRDFFMKYQKLFEKQIKEMNLKTSFILINSSLIDKYISLFEGYDLENLFQIKYIIQNYNIIDIKKDLNKIIFQTGLILSKDGFMTNLEIIDFIRFLIKEKKTKESLEILSGLNINNFDNKFYHEWSKFKWYIMLGENNDLYELFIDKVINLLKNLSDIGLLWKLLNTNTKSEKIELNIEALEKIKEKFKRLCIDYDIDQIKNINLNDYFLPLTIISKNPKKRDKNIIVNFFSFDFLTKLKTNIYYDKVSILFSNLLIKHSRLLDKNIINLITDFFIKDVKLNSKIILDILLNCEDEIQINFIKKLSSAIPEEKDFLSKNNTEKYKLFKGLLDNGFITNNNYKSLYYISESKKIIENLQKNFKSDELKLDWIKQYYFDSKNRERNEKDFEEKLLTIFLNDKKESFLIKLKCENEISKIKKQVESMKLILEDFMENFQENQKNNIIIIKSYIKNIYSGSLNYYEKNKEIIDNLINKYEQDSRKRYILKRSFIYLQIHKNQKNKNEYNNIKESETEFQKLKKIFQINDIQSLDKELLQLLITVIKGKNKNEISKEIDILEEIFEIKASQIIKDKIIHNFLILSKKEVLIEISEAIILLIKNLNLIKGELFNLVNKIVNNREKLNNEKVLYGFIKDLQDCDIDIDILYNNGIKYSNYLKILIEINNKPDSIYFLITKNQNECMILKKYNEENIKEYIDMNILISFEECIKFMESFGKFQLIKDYQFFNLFQNKVINTKNIEKYFINYTNNYDKIKKLYQKNFDRLGALKYEICSICNNSKFILKNKPNYFFYGYYQKLNEKNEENLVDNIININALKDLSNAIRYIMNNNKEDINNIEKYNKFIEIINIVCKIYKLIKELYSSGYPFEIEIIVTLINFIPNYEGCDLNTSSSEKIINRLTEILYDLKKKQIFEYNNLSLIRYIYGPQLRLIYEKICNKKDNDISPILQFISNNSSIKENIIEYNINKEENIFFNIENYLKKELEKNYININKINEQNKILKRNEENEIYGIYLLQADNDKKYVIELYKYLTSKNPQEQYILYCNKETTNEELKAFLYRAIFCHLNSCFFITGIELLQFNQKNILLYIINDLYSKNKMEMKSSLFVIFKNYNEHLINYIFKMKKIRSNFIKLPHIDIFIDNVEIILSDKAGVGKSTYIKSQIQYSRRNYIYFPINGLFDRKDIFNRLKELNKLNGINNGTIHLDLYYSNEFNLINEFLYFILFTKVFRQGEDIFILPNDIPIFIEIQNGFLIEKFPILNNCKKTMLNIEKLNPILISEKKNSNIQIVASYLKYLKEKIDLLNDYNIFIEGISPIKWKSSYETINIINLSQEECQKLIFEKINEKIKTPNYYQIISFINLLATQLKKFSKNYFFSSQNINEKKYKYNYLKDIRSYIIEKIIISTQYIISNKIINEHINSDINENINKVMEENNIHNNFISYDKIETSLIFFQEGDGEGFIIIANPKNRKDYDILSKIAKLQSSNVLIPRQINKRSIEIQMYFLKQLKYLLNINNEIGECKNEYNLEENKENLPKNIEYIKNEEKELNNKKLDNAEEEAESDEETSEENESIINIQDNDNIENEKTLIEIADDYVFTLDNYLKMALILLRITANIPVILMGETGCGKTFLIKKLSEFLNNGKKNKIKILNIHAGINDKDIIRFLQKKVIPEAMFLQEVDEERRKKLGNLGHIFNETKLWVFFDGINTCKSINLINEIICNHTCQGISLPQNIAFIAACNPFRYKNEKENPDNDIKNNNINEIKKDDKSTKDKNRIFSSDKTLIYSVYPLPISLMNFVIDFGYMSVEDEKIYVNNILEKIENKYYFKYKSERLQEKDSIKINDLALNMIIKSQNFIRTKNDISSVSLRDIKRFFIIFKFFFDYIKHKKDIDIIKKETNYLLLENYKYYSKISFKDIYVHSIILSLFICYYLRISKKNDRNELINILDNTLRNYDSHYYTFFEIINREKDFIKEIIEFEKGIFINNALLINLISLFVAINTKIPIFIVGDPGFSKSLSVRIISKAMKGEESNKLFFKKYPKIFKNYYQVSKDTSYKEVKDVFKKSRNIIKTIKKQHQNEIRKNKFFERINNQDIISMICLNEIGLEENSPNIPLKIINKELDKIFDEKNESISFVCISNLTHDASIMNRGLFIPIPLFEENEIKDISFSIAALNDYSFANTYKDLYRSIGEDYYYYKQYLISQFNNGYEEFHGNIDFYHLVNNVSKKIIKENTHSLSLHTQTKFLNDDLERNFSGLIFKKTKESSIKRIKKYFRYDFFMYDEYLFNSDSYNKIDKNIEDEQGRYLLIITNQSTFKNVLTLKLKNQKKLYNYFKGSPFKNDDNNERYKNNILNKILIDAQQEKIIILNNLETLYPRLYELFKQNFENIDNKNYSRIISGYSTNFYSHINNKFRFIIITDENRIRKENIVYYNFFEKHIYSFENILDKNAENKCQEIYNILMKLTQNDEAPNKFMGINYKLKEIFINLNKEEIYAYIYYYCQLKEKNNYELFNDFVFDLIDECIKKLSLLLPQDIVLILKYGNFNKKYPRIAGNITNSYYKSEHKNLSSFLKKMKNNKNIIYTFTNYFSNIDNFDIIKNEMLGDIKKENIFIININSYSSALEFEDDLNEGFFEDNNKKLCIIKFKSDERNFLNYVKSLFENKEREICENIKKAWIFIVYLTRTFEDIKIEQVSENEDEDMNKYNETISLSSDFYQIFIDDLNGTEKYEINDILNLNTKELLMKWIDYNKLIDRNIFQTLSYFEYDIPYQFKKIHKNNYAEEIAKMIIDNKNLKSKINEVIITQMAKDENIIYNCLNKKNLISIGDISILSCIRKYLKEIYIKQFNTFYYKAEREQFFSSLLSINTININVDKLFNKEINEIKEENENFEIQKKIIINIVDIYLDKFAFLENQNYDNYNEEDKQNIKDFNFVEEYKKNKVDIILGLQLPGIFPKIISIIKKIRNDIIKRYGKNESNLRKNIKDENIDIEKKEYKKCFKILNNYLNIELNQCLNILKDEGFELLLDNYYIIFINTNLKNYLINLEKSNPNFKLNLSELKNIIKLLVNKIYKLNTYRFNKDTEEISTILNWMEYYSTEISYILKIYLFLSNHTNNIYNKMKEIIEDEKVSYDCFERSEEYTSYVNKALFLGFESLLKIITSDVKIYLNISTREDFDKFINVLKNIYLQVNKFYTNLKIYSNEILNLNEIILILDCLNANKIYTRVNLVKLLKYYSSEINIEIFEEFHINLKMILSKYETYYKITSVIFKNEFIKFHYKKDIKIKIIEIIASNSNYIYHNCQLLKKFLNFNIKPCEIGENLSRILNDCLLGKINNYSINELLEKNIFDIYSFLFMNYFAKTPSILKNYIENKTNEKDISKYPKLVQNLNNENEYNINILFDLSFDIFKDCLNFLYKLNDLREGNYNLAKLYSISYISVYLSKLVNISLNQKKIISLIEDIFKLIKDDKNKLNQTIIVYIIKLFYNSTIVNRNFDKLFEIKFTDLGYNFIENMLNDKSSKITILREIIEEKNSQKSEIFKNYPYLNYFTYPINILNHFKEQLKSDKDFINKFPLIYIYFEKINDKKFYMLNYLEKYIEFCNFMLENYSFQIEREKAKERKLRDENIFKCSNKDKKNIFNDFFKCWDKIKEYATKYKSNKMEVKALNENDSLAYYLNDNNELGYGMYIAAGYEFFINLQNEFLNLIIEHGKDKPYLQIYFDNMKNKIPIYEANNYHILNIDDLNEYKDFKDLINTFSKRINSYELEFDFQSIEEELAKIILPGKCLFKDENNLNFIKYLDELFINENRNLLSIFEKKYSIEELTKSEKIQIYENIKNDHFDISTYEKLYSYTLLFINHLINNNCNEEQEITEINDEFRNLYNYTYNVPFSSFFKDLKIKKIISAFLFIEYHCFDIFNKKIKDEFKMEINGNIKNKINERILNNKIDNIKEIARAVRRFISRYLFPKSNINPNEKLIEHLKRFDLWAHNLRKKEILEKIIDSICEFNLSVGQATKFYEIIKQYDEMEFKQYYLESEQNRIQKRKQGKKHKIRFKN